MKRGAADAAPTERPLRGETRVALERRFEQALADGAGNCGAHCVHELWMRGEISVAVEHWLARLWRHPTAAIPDWLPMRYVDWLPQVYEIALGFRARAKGRSHLYLVLLDYGERRGYPYGIYVGMSQYPPAQRFDQHKAGIRAAGSVLKRGLEVLTGPTLHLQWVKRSEAQRIEAELASALADAGLLVKGGH